MKSTINLLIILSAAGLALTLSGCTDHSKPNVELIQDMMESPAIRAQEYDEASPNHSGMRVPPEGTKPVGFTLYKYAADLEGAKSNKNPFAGEDSDEILKVGNKMYETNCAVCHGHQGEGAANSSVGQKMGLQPPSLLSAKVVGWSDGQIYHVITMGQGLMGPYASHIPQEYRWQVVNYIRHLQKNQK